MNVCSFGLHHESCWPLNKPRCFVKFICDESDLLIALSPHQFIHREHSSLRRVRAEKCQDSEKLQADTFAHSLVISSVLGPSLATKLPKGLVSWLKPIAEKYANLAGYRQHGLKYDDIIIEETATVQKALNRLSERESYDRAYRLRQASMCAIAHNVLPKDQWVKPQDDKRYLMPLVKEIELENEERAHWDNVTVDRNAKH